MTLVIYYPIWTLEQHYVWWSNFCTSPHLLLPQKLLFSNLHPYTVVQSVYFTNFKWHLSLQPGLIWMMPLEMCSTSPTRIFIMALSPSWVWDSLFICMIVLFVLSFYKITFCIQTCVAQWSTSLHIVACLFTAE